MYKIFFCFFALPGLFFAQNVQKKIHVLFLGNSYTYVNNLPLLIKNIAMANGDTLIYDSNTPGGYTFNNHFVDPVSLSKINSFPWKFVVLQAQSQEPAFPPSQVNAQTLPYAMKLDSVIKQNHNCSNTVFYETWGRKNGDAQNCASYPPLCTYLGMQDRLKQSYKKFADTTNAIMSPVGEAFRRSVFLNPSLELYDLDESHPSLSGSYLAACVFYEVLFQKSVISNTYNPGIATNAMSFFQQVAHVTVSDSLAVWNLGVNLPLADFSFAAINATAYQFQSTASNFLNTWYFGDGGTSATSSPLHYYTNAGTFNVSHVVYDVCNKDSISTTLVVTPTDVQQNSKQGGGLTIYPNPCTNVIFINAADEFKNNASHIDISNALGQIVFSENYAGSIFLDHLQRGLYIIKIYNRNAATTGFFLKQE